MLCCERVRRKSVAVSIRSERVTVSQPVFDLPELRARAIDPWIGTITGFDLGMMLRLGAERGRRAPMIGVAVLVENLA